MKSILALLLILGFLNASDENYKLGKEIYQKTCVSCHGVNGEGNKHVSFITNPKHLNKSILTQEQAFIIIKQGAHEAGAGSDIMPRFKYNYSDDELQDVSYYISKAINSNRDERVQKLLDESDAVAEIDKSKMLEIGKKIFTRNCSMCHGINGDAQSEYIEKSRKEKNFIYPQNLQKTLLDEEQIFLYVKYGGQYWGSPETNMPSWKVKYKDFELKSVAKYVNEQIKIIK